MKRLFFVLFLGGQNLYAQLPGSAQAVLLAQGNAGVARQEHSQVWSNLAGIKDTQRVVSVSVCQPFSVMGMNRYSMALLLPWKTSGGFFRASTLGNTVYRRTRWGVGVFHHQGNTSFGMSTDYLQEETDGFPVEYALLFSGGVQFEFSSHWRAGASAEAIPVLHRRDLGERMKMAAGLCWKPTPGLNCMVDWQQYKNESSVIAVGISYEYGRCLAFYCGWRSDAACLSVGASVKWNRFRLDYGFRYQPAPGNTQALSLNCYW